MGLCRPSIIVLAVSAFSLFAYLLGLQLVPAALPDAVGLKGSLLMIGWYLILACVCEIGFQIGRAASGGSGVDHNAEEGAARFLTLSLLGLVGTAAVAVTILPTMGLSGILDALTGSTANSMKKELQQDYQIGFLSLRYICILSSALALRYVFIDSAELRPRSGLIRAVSCLDLGALLIVAIISSRLSLVASFFIAVTDSYLKGKIRAFTLLSVGAVLTFLFIVLAGLNWTRNAGYYSQQYRTDNPLTMNVVESVRYAGYPWGASSVAATVLYRNPSINANPKGVIHVLGRAAAPGETHINWFEDYTRFDESLTTNSAFVEASGYAGIYGLAAYLFLSLGWSGVFGWCANRRGLNTLIAGVILYGFAESIRLNLFVTGIYQTMIVVAVLIEGCAAMLTRNDEARRY